MTEEEFEPPIDPEWQQASDERHAAAIEWTHTGNGEFPYRADFKGRTLVIRVNDFPAEPLYTLLVDDEEIEDLDDWPRRWVKPEIPKDLLDFLHAGRMGQPSLPGAIAELYRVFGRYPLGDVDGCPHCVRPADQALIRSRPLRELPAEALERYAFKAISTWGNADDLRHFLPRLLELGVGAGVQGLELLADKLRYAGWRSWPVDEQSVITEFLSALWTTSLDGCGCPLRAVDLLSDVLAIVDHAVAPYLAIWRARVDEPALLQLAELITSTFDTEPKNRHPEVVAWLVDPATAEAVEAGFFAASSPQVADALSAAADVLDLLRATA